MEFNPILERADIPSPGLWYVISSPSCPTPRVGQACACGSPSQPSDVYVVGGADPSTTYNDIYRFNTKRFTWNVVKCDDFTARYEHCALIPNTKPSLVYVFGGANKENNLNTVQAINIETGECSSVECDGRTPSPRTSHTAASSGSLLYVWCGGLEGSVPVPDLSLHVFDTDTHEWRRSRLKGTTPDARHGHIMQVVGNYLYIHGGMSGNVIYDDLYQVDLTDFTSTKLQPTGEVPCFRAAHSSCVVGSRIYVFGGLSPDGALNDLFVLDTDKMEWKEVKFDSPPPTPRLDHSLVFTFLSCRKRPAADQQPSSDHVTPNGDVNGGHDSPRPDVIATSSPDVTVTSSPPAAAAAVSRDDANRPIIVPVDLWEGTTAAGDSNQHHVTTNHVTDQLARLDVLESPRRDDDDVVRVPVLLVFGGMDASGNIFNDLLVTNIDGVVS